MQSHAYQRWLGCLGMVVALLVGSAGCRRAEQPQSQPPTVSVIRLENRDHRGEISASGLIEAVDKAEVAFMVAGRVSRLAAEDGESVAAGQLLAELDAADYADALAAAEARLAEVGARHERLTRLHEMGSLTATDFDKINAALAEARAGVDLARRRVEYTRLTAPFAGRVVRRGVAVGTVVAPGIPVFSVQAPSPVWAVLSVPEVDAPHLAAGQPAKISLAAAEGVVETGVVETVLPQAEPLSRSFSVKVKLANADGRFRAGNVVTARIAAGPDRQVLSLPPEVIQRYPDGGLYVWTVDPGSNTVVRRIVGVGRVRDQEIEIVSGLEPGALVVRGGTIPLYDGLAVNLATP